MNDFIGENKNNLTNELAFNFINYAAAVNTDRAIPDATSGLKPVAKRILYGAYDGGRTSNKPHVKNARIVGDVMGNWHPHGDSSIYGALVRLAQPWVMRYPLLDFHGNMGNIDGDGPAAARYTEARLSKISEDGLLAGLKKRNVPFGSNYDETLEEPLTLPSIFPNLLCNPNTGIGVAMACNWLPHNLGEVANAIYDYMDGKEPTIPGPDFPTGGIIINEKDIPNILLTGKGSVKVRGRYKVEKNKIIFYEIPFGTTTEEIMEEIGTVSDSKEIEGITNIRNESTLKGMRIVIQCDKNTSPDSIASKLFLKTKLQKSISYNQVALVDKTPTELNFKDCIKIYIEHNDNCLQREIIFDRNKAKARKEIVEGLLRALEDIDNIIALIKKSKSSIDAKDQLIKIYNFSENQAKAIVNMKLGSLAGLEKLELEKENQDLDDTLKKCTAYLSDINLRLGMIRERLSNIVRKYGDKRRTEITQISISKEDKEVEAVIPEDVVVVMYKNGNIKKVPKKSFRVQRRGGKGVKTKGDSLLDVISTNTIDRLMLFTSSGKMLTLLVDNIPTANNTSRGIPIRDISKLGEDEEVIAISSLERKTKAKYVVFITKKGLVKKTLLSEYSKVKRETGIIAINIKEGDGIANVFFMDEEDLILITKRGMSIHFETKSINPIGRATAGVKGIKLEEGDEVINGVPLASKEGSIGIFTAGGFGKKVSIKEFLIQSRAGKGVLCYKPTLSTGDIIGAEYISSDDEEILLTGESSSICIQTVDVPLLGRNSLGNIMSKNKVLSVVKL